MTPRNVVIEGDALMVLRGLASDSVDACCTSPPYLGLREYDAGSGEIGREAHVDEWVENVRGVCAEVRRVLAPHGSLWLNVGDSLSRHSRFGAPPKSFLAGPERLLVALIADGWICRSRVVWSKTNPLPSSVRDRLTATHEMVFHLVKAPRYYFDLDAIREPLVSSRKPRRTRDHANVASLGRLAGSRSGLARMAASGISGNARGKNPGDSWRLPSGRGVGGHFATFPEALVRRPILATCPERVCTRCNLPTRRGAVSQPGCVCGGPTRPGLVLDPFAGSGTTLKVGRDLGRDVLGIELAPRYAQLARERSGLGHAADLAVAQ